MSERYDISGGPNATQTKISNMLQPDPLLKAAPEMRDLLEALWNNWNETKAMTWTPLFARIREVLDAAAARRTG